MFWCDKGNIFLLIHKKVNNNKEKYYPYLCTKLKKSLSLQPNRYEFTSNT